jgi:GGDEF domain-containing protein
VDGDFVRDVMLPGADPSRTPAVIPVGVLPELDEVTRLVRSDIDRIGFPGGEDVALARLGDGPGSWLFAIAGSMEADEMQRLGLYVALMEQAIARATQTTTAEVVSALSKLLLADSTSPEEQAREAIRIAQKALGIKSAAFTVTSRTGAAVLHVGSSFTAADLAAGSGAGKIVIIRRDPRLYAMAFVGDWSPDHRVTQQESLVTETIADLLEAWVRRLVRQSPRTADRRAARRGFDEVLERFARDAVQGGVPVTAVVITFGDAEFQPDVTQARVVRLREHLRGGDLVGRLAEGDVGILLHDTAEHEAEVPIARLRHVLEREGVLAREMSIGMASRRPGEPMTGALAQEARQGARYHASDN